MDLLGALVRTLVGGVVGALKLPFVIVPAILRGRTPPAFTAGSPLGAALLVPLVREMRPPVPADTPPATITWPPAASPGPRRPEHTTHTYQSMLAAILAGLGICPLIHPKGCPTVRPPECDVNYDVQQTMAKAARAWSTWLPRR